MMFKHEPSKGVKRQDLLKKGIEITDGSRQTTHGDWNAQHKTASELWTAFLGFPVSSHDVCICLNLLKVSRTKHGAFNVDDYLDGGVYMMGAAECYENEELKGE